MRHAFPQRSFFIHGGRETFLPYKDLKLTELQL
jgi:hypothetical protein